MGTEPVVVDCARSEVADLGLVDRLARLGLEARRRGRGLVLRDPSPRLVELIRLCGLAAVLRVEPQRQPKQREQPLGVEEEGDLGDPPV